MAPPAVGRNAGDDSDSPRCNIKNCKTLDDNVTPRAPQRNKHHYGDVEHGLDDLDRLPLEVQSNILVQSDLQTLVGFRQVNRRSREVVDALPEYQKVLHFSPTLLRGIFSIELETFITCQALVTTLNTQKCESCGDPSEYIHLLSCRRVCCHCLLSRDDYKLITLECAEWDFQVPRRLLEGLPTMRPVPGKYAAGKFLLPFRIAQVDRASASLAGSSYRAERMAALRRTRRTRFRRVVLPVVGAEPERAASVAYQAIDESRFMSVVRAPLVQRSDEILEPAFCDCGVRSSCPAVNMRDYRDLDTALRRFVGGMGGRT
jgi:hypothetical protein